MIGAAMAQRIFRLAKQMPKDDANVRRVAWSAVKIAAFPPFVRTQGTSSIKMAREATAFASNKPFGNLAGKICLGMGIAAVAGGLTTGIEIVRLQSSNASSQGETNPQLSSEENAMPRKLYPPIKPYNSGFLKVDDLHKLYYEECGNKDGKPIVFLHGGPGGGIDEKNRQFFDPAHYRIVLFDQRGSGKSTPHACVEGNNTWALVDDIEKLRTHLGIDKWHVFGGSWGSTLALTYSICNPSRVSGLILRGIFLLREFELKWMYQFGGHHVYPDQWESYEGFIPADERHDLIAAYHKRLFDSENEKERLEAAQRWTTWEMETSYLIPSEVARQRGSNDDFALAFAVIENHYFYNKGFFPSDNWIIENICKIRDIPTSIIQGRYDMVCPMKSAWDLHRAFPEASFVVVPDAGHSANEVGITSELVKATDKFRNIK